MNIASVQIAEAIVSTLRAYNEIKTFNIKTPYGLLSPDLITDVLRNLIFEGVVSAKGSSYILGPNKTLNLTKIKFQNHTVH